MKPQEAKTFEQICKLQTDNVQTADSWLQLDEGVIVIQNQRKGEAATGRVELTRAEFDKFIAWYQRDQKERKK
jgi:hypothetical protein